MEATVLNYREKKLKQELAELRAELKALKSEKKIVKSQNSFFGNILNAIPSDLVVFDMVSNIKRSQRLTHSDL